MRTDKYGYKGAEEAEQRGIRMLARKAPLWLRVD
jgi:hypothetical protein